MKNFPTRLSFLAILFLLTFSACQTNISQKSLENFYSFDGAEDQLMDPLILAGENVVPLVIEKIKDKEMTRRRYAIGFLGNGSYRQALPVLESILKDESEKDYFRGDALHAIFKIDESVGLSYAKQFTNDKSYIGNIANSILKRDKYVLERRSYQDAVDGKHE